MKRAPLESEIENARLDYGMDGLPRKHQPEVSFKVDLCKVWKWWKRHKERKREASR